MPTFEKYFVYVLYNKNLLSISKLTKDNNFVIEFYSYSCFVKDRKTRVMLLKGIVKDSLYQFQPSTYAYISNGSKLV